jgi:hypothetical protein
MSKAQRVRKNSVFTSGGKFPVLTLSYINKALSQSAFRIYKCYIIIYYIISYHIISLKSRVDITQYQHGNVGKFLSLYFFVLYYKTNIKHFFRIDI